MAFLRAGGGSSGGTDYDYICTYTGKDKTSIFAIYDCKNDESIVVLNDSGSSYTSATLNGLTAYFKKPNEWYLYFANDISVITMKDRNSNTATVTDYTANTIWNSLNSDYPFASAVLKIKL